MDEVWLSDSSGMSEFVVAHRYSWPRVPMVSTVNKLRQTRKWFTKSCKILTGKFSGKWLEHILVTLGCNRLVSYNFSSWENFGMTGKRNFWSIFSKLMIMVSWPPWKSSIMCSTNSHHELTKYLFLDKYIFLEFNLVNTLDKFL